MPEGRQSQPMKVREKDLPHASSAALDRLDDLLGALRSLKGMRETSRGRFYRRGRTFLHFHEVGADLFADVKWSAIGWAFERISVTAAAEREALIERVKASLAEPRPAANPSRGRSSRT